GRAGTEREGEIEERSARDHSGPELAQLLHRRAGRGSEHLGGLARPPEWARIDAGDGEILAERLQQGEEPRPPLGAEPAALVAGGPLRLGGGVANEVNARLRP